VTTEAVLWSGSTHSPPRRRATAAGVYRRAHANRRVEVVSFDPELDGAAVDLYRRRGDKDWSLTDCLSVVVMERRGLTEALTTDHHFEQAGMKALMLSLPSL